MMFTLIAVALGGYVMVESAPDFSNYAVLTRSQQLDRNLSHLREVISSRPFYLTTADGILGDQPNDILAKAELEDAVERLVHLGPPAPSPLPLPVSYPANTRTIGTSVPHDPFIPVREQGAQFYAASYNFVADAAFYEPDEREARDLGAIQGLYATVNSNDDTSVVLFDRFGRFQQNIVSPPSGGPPGGEQLHHISLSPDGTRILASTSILTDDPLHHDIVTFSPRGSSRHFATAVGNPSSPPTSSNLFPEWSPQGDLVAFVHVDVPTNDHRMVFQRPERGARRFDPIQDNRDAGLIGADTFPNYDAMGRPHWSPDGTFLAFWAQGPSDTRLLVYNVRNRVWVWPRPRGGIGGVEIIPPSGVQVRSGGCALAFSPDSDRIIYADTGGVMRALTGLKNGAGAILNDPAYFFPTLASERDPLQIRWAPPAAVPPSSDPTTILYLNPGGELVRVDPVNGGSPVRIRLVDNVEVAVPASPSFEHRYFDISPGGTKVLFTGPGANQVVMAGIDGHDRRVILNNLAIGGDPVRDVLFRRPPTAWVYPDAAVRKLTQADAAIFDRQGWRAFQARESLFRGDNRFGRGYLQLKNADAPDQFLFDNRDDLFRVPRVAPTNTVRDGAGNHFPRILGKGECAWDWRGTNFVARETGDVTGGAPADLFKQTVEQSGTTILVTTGSNPAVAPDDQLLAVSKAMSAFTTFPVDTTNFPIEDTDIWVVDVNGGSDPAPANLTPDTTETAESHPDWSPDGRYVYFQREAQRGSRFLGNHSSGIYRTTRNGGTITAVVEAGSIPAAWNNNDFVSALEFYEPAVSPDGTRLAFIARERLLSLGSLAGSVSTSRVGEIIGEALYVKDLELGSQPVCLLRSFDGEIAGLEGAPYAPKTFDGTQQSGPADMFTGDHTGNDAYANHGFHRPSWSADGQEIFLTRTHPRNSWFPKKTLTRAGPIGPPTVRNLNYRQVVKRSQLIRVKATLPYRAGSGFAGITILPDDSADPPADNFDVILQNVPDSASHNGAYATHPQNPPSPEPVFDWEFHYGTAPAPTIQQRQILRAVSSKGAVVTQRVFRDGPSAGAQGVSLTADYVLSGYVRTNGGTGAQQSAQLTVSVLNNRGLLVELNAPGRDEFQIGLVDVGGDQWTRFSAGFRLSPRDASPLENLKIQGPNFRDDPPYTLLLSLYSFGPGGSEAEFTGIKLERAFEPGTRAPTAFFPAWGIHSSSLRPDPGRANSMIFER